MTYQFPVIRHIDDVLPYIEDRPEIIVAEKEGYSVINYVVSTPELWKPATDLKNQIIRECRGLIFDSKGNLISRPLHKFFNVGEKEETQAESINFAGHSIYEKLDGSMIRPLSLDLDGYGANNFRLATKMGITDTSMQAEEWLVSNRERMLNYRGFFDFCYGFEHTPIFEWISRENRIVITYDEPDLVLLAMRDLYTGEYIPYDEMCIHASEYDIPVVMRHSSFDSISDFLVQTKAETGNEGYVIELSDGNRVKIKTDEYSRIHKLKERVQQPRHIVALILDEQIDDAKAGLDSIDRKMVEDWEINFHCAFQRRAEEIDAVWEYTRNSFKDKRDFAINTTMEVSMRKFMFAKFSEKSTRDILTDLVLANIGGEKKFQEFWDGYFSK